MRKKKDNKTSTSWSGQVFVHPTKGDVVIHRKEAQDKQMSPQMTQIVRHMINDGTLRRMY